MQDFARRLDVGLVRPNQDKPVSYLCLFVPSRFTFISASFIFNYSLPFTPLWAVRLPILLTKLNADGKIVRNKARLVAKRYIQEFGVDFEESYALVVRLETVRLLLAYVASRKIKLYQIDVKSTFLNGYVNDEVYVDQPPEFNDISHPNHVFKLKKTLYGLKQAPRVWYDRLSTFLLDEGNSRGKVD